MVLNPSFNSGIQGTQKNRFETKSGQLAPLRLWMKDNIAI